MHSSRLEGAHREGGGGVIFVGIDWSEHHHDVCVVDERGTQLAKVRVGEGVEGVARLHETIADHAAEPEEVIVGIEIDRGLLVGAPGGRRVPGVRDQPDVGGSVSRSPRHLGRQV